MTDPELLLESIRGFLDGRSQAAEFAQDFDYLEKTNGVSDPAQLCWTFEDLGRVTSDYLDEFGVEEPPDEVFVARMRAQAQTTYETAVDIIRRRGLRNIY